MIRCRFVTFSVAAIVCAAAPARGQAAAPVRLTLREAEARAVDRSPVIRASRETAMAAMETVRETRAAFYPTAVASLTGAGAQDGTRIAAGGFNNPTILNRLAGGVSVSQMLTDFRRTSNLAQGQVLRGDAQARDTDTRRADVLLQVDRAYFQALGAMAVRSVARDTVDARQLVVDQVTALAQGNLRSGLDVSFARVGLAQAKLLQVQADNDVRAAFATLTAAMGSTDAGVEYDLQPEELPAPPPDSAAPLVAQAVAERPDVLSRRLTEQAADRFVAAERALWFPTVSLVGAAGITPYHQVGLTDRYSAVGINVTVPFSNGNLFQARHAEAAFRAQAEHDLSRDLETRVTRDVTVAWLAAKTAYERVDLTRQLLQQASDALDLAQARYNLGLSSIVELSQAQLAKTEAGLVEARARFDYQAQMAALKYQTGG